MFLFRGFNPQKPHDEYKQCFFESVSTYWSEQLGLHSSITDDRVDAQSNYHFPKGSAHPTLSVYKFGLFVSAQQSYKLIKVYVTDQPVPLSADHKHPTITDGYLHNNNCCTITRRLTWVIVACLQAVITNSMDRDLDGSPPLLSNCQWKPCWTFLVLFWNQ